MYFLTLLILGLATWHALSNGLWAEPTGYSQRTGFKRTRVHVVASCVPVISYLPGSGMRWHMAQSWTWSASWECPKLGLHFENKFHRVRQSSSWLIVIFSHSDFRVICFYSKTQPFHWYNWSSLDHGQGYDVMGEENRGVKDDSHISGIGS